jgi:hypothetical protein
VCAVEWRRWRIEEEVDVAVTAEEICSSGVDDGRGDRQSSERATEY